jgi:DHA2 family multidrug resistance protein
VMQRLGMAQAGLVARGFDHANAAQTAGRMLDGVLARQASVLAFERMFLLAGAGFLLVIPLALLLKGVKGARAPRGGAH